MSEKKERVKKEKVDKEKEKLKKKIHNLEIEVANMEEKMLRNQAETVNYRKRKDEEFRRLAQMANAEVIKSILPYLDDFERAIAMNHGEQNEEISKFLSGFQMIHDNFMNALYGFNLKEIDGINKPFDPIYHEAMMKEKKEETEPGAVIEILQKGYLLNGRVLRPAKVKVSE